MSKTRQPVKPVNLSTDAVHAAAKAEAARKRASKAALRASKHEDVTVEMARGEPDFEAAPVPRETEPTAPPPNDPIRVAAQETARIEALRVDWQALTDSGAFEGTFEEYLLSQEVAAPGERLVSAATISMRGLHTAAKHYVRGIHNGDSLATVLDGLTREQVIFVLGNVLMTAGVTSSLNPYAALNPGQQSMNLRNKFRGAHKNGLATLEAVATAIELLNVKK